MTRRPIVAALLACGALLAGSASAQPAPPADRELFEQGAKALAVGEFGAAIDAFEALADRGFSHPDASYDRGLAYVQRVRAHADRPGDLGRAAAGFEEALLLAPDDADAQLALDLVRAEVARRRARRDKEVVDARPTIDRVIVALAPEEVWGLCAVGASLLLGLGLVLRRRPGRVHVAGAVLAPTALVLLAAFSPLAYGARKLRLETRSGVVVVPDVGLSPEPGAPPAREPSLQEASLVEVGERRAGFVHVRWGSTEGWLPAAAVRVLAR